MKNHLFMGCCALVAMYLISSCSEPFAQPADTSCYTIVVEETEVDNTSIKQLQVDCPDFMKAVGAGWSVLDETSAILDGQATYFEPSYDGSSWLTYAKNESSFAANWKLRVRLICACESSF